MASGAKIGLGVFGCRADAGTFVETYSSFNGTTPSNFIRFAFLCENRTPGIYDTGDQFGFEVTGVESAFESSRATRGTVHMTENNANPSTLARRAYQRTFNGVALINDGLSAATQWDVKSSTAGGLNALRNGASMPNTCTYGTLIVEWGSNGGWQAFANNYLVDSVDQTVSNAGTQSADLILVSGIYGGSPVNSESFTQNRIMWGFFNPVTRKGFTFSTAYWNGAIATNFLAMSRTKMLNTRNNPDGFRLQIELGSVSATGTMTWEVTSTFNTIANTTNICGMAMRLQDLGVSMGLVPLTMGATNTVNSFQTNSVSPEGLLTIASLVKSIDTYQTSNDINQGSYSFGFWEYSENKNTHATIFNRTQTGSTANQNTVGSSWLNYVAQNQAAGQAFAIRSVTTGSGGWAGVVNTTSANGFTGSYLGFVAFGEKVAAPQHLMDASSSSIFLADDSDYDDNLLLVGSAAAAPSVTSTTFRAGTFQSLVSTAAQAEAYALDGALPKVRVHEQVMGTTGTNTTQTIYRASLGTAVFSSDGLGKTYATHAFRNQDGLVSSPNRDGALVTDVGGLFISATTNTEFQVTVGSVAADQANINMPTGGNSYGYNAYVFAGSISAENGLSTVLANSTGEAAICSMSFKPDLIYVLGNFSTDAAANSETVGDTQGFGYGFYDVRSTFGRYLNHTYFNGTPDVPQHNIASTMGRITPDIFAAEYDVASIGAAGFYIKCVAANTIDGRTHRFGFMGIKFDDPTIKFKLVDYTGPLSSGVQSFGFDFSPKFVHFLGTTTSSLGYLAQSGDVPAGNAMTQGFWSQSGDLGASFSFVEGGTSTTDARVGYTNSAMALFRAGLDEPPEIASIGSVTIQGSTALNFYTNVFTTTGQNFKGVMLVIGPNEAGSTAPGSTPPSSSAPAAGALFRKFPDTDDREFPLPLTNVRAFPSD